MYMLIILKIIDIFFFYSQRSMAERLFARWRTENEPIPSIAKAPIPPMDAMSLCFIYN